MGKPSSPLVVRGCVSFVVQSRAVEIHSPENQNWNPHLRNPELENSLEETRNLSPMMWRWPTREMCEADDVRNRPKRQARAQGQRGDNHDHPPLSFNLEPTPQNAPTMRVLGGTLALLLAAGKVRCAFRFCWLRVSCEALVRGGNWHIGEMSDEGREMDAALALPCGSVEKIDGVMEWGSLESLTR